MAGVLFRSPAHFLAASIAGTVFLRSSSPTRSSPSVGRGISHFLPPNSCYSHSLSRSLILKNIGGLKIPGSPPAIHVNQAPFLDRTVWARYSFAIECLRCLPTSLGSPFY